MAGSLWCVSGNDNAPHLASLELVVAARQGRPMTEHKGYMGRALEEAMRAARRGEVPVGAVVVDAEENVVIAACGNRVIERHDPTAHAEMLAIREAADKLSNERLVGCDLYVTLEPCPMCAQALALARIRRLYFGASDPKGGGVEHGPRIFEQPTCHHRPEIYGGIDAQRATVLLKDFFSTRR